ncbi:MAG: hypothetical protein U1E33_08960 [Rhodospirillales bacterium]
MPKAAPNSLAASSRIFLGAAWACELVRPGAALYGVAPVPARDDPVGKVDHPDRPDRTGA